MVRSRSFHDYSSHEIQPLRVLLLGSPGSGKGTQSERLKKNFGVSHLSSGDILRKNIKHHTKCGQIAAEYVAKGKLVPDNLLVNLVNTELSQMNNHNWLLDGFPRTQPQAEALDKMLNKLMQPLNLVINLEVPEEVILERIMDRWVHIPSGRVYNLSYNPPRVPGLDDLTGEPLSKRPDDSPEVFHVRMQQHKAMTAPLLNHYRTIAVTVCGNTSDEIYPQIEREIVNRLGVLPSNLVIPYVSSLSAKRSGKIRRKQQNLHWKDKKLMEATAGQ
ncbi:adenylate kinase-domain-containing protein [Radiomyces spectabilis]|uniref:adenylate kinase-domain-containing protein n=1 Tax=Radiomyces spectabilis TaxID=64574 RepID=UPI00221F13A0|nr:adenylate kinase-domain-containing protein [Radiomyces spectabilis]KAI8385027.1 adenylate kinase-domain-containing protein [Radiomyces spectabilis]